MTTAPDNPRLQDAFTRTQSDIARLMDWLSLELDKRSDPEKATWSILASLEHVRGNLIDTLEFISDVDRENIQRSLDGAQS
jgi:hypothetical protein